MVALSPRRGSRRLAPVIGGASQPSSPEYRHLDSNPTLLTRIMEITGGRALDVAQPQEADLFDRAGMPPSRAALPAWGPLLWVALFLLLADVAARRLSWDAALLRRGVARAAARTVPAGVRGGEAAATLATLRQTSGRRPPTSSPTRAPVARPIKASHPSPAAGAPEAPEPSTVSAALDALLGRGGATEAPQAPQPPDPAPDAEGSSETTSSLLAAKRRARRKLDG